jgi:hypothetical protein
MNVKSTMALVALLFVFSIPAHAQAAGSAVSNNRASSGGGGGASGGSAGGGSVSFHTPTHNPTTQFQMTAASGSSDYVPSTYLAYDKALSAGQTALAAKPQTIVEAAQANKQTKAADSEYLIVQDKNGNLVEESRK